MLLVENDQNPLWHDEERIEAPAEFFYRFRRQKQRFALRGRYGLGGRAPRPVLTRRRAHQARWLLWRCVAAVRCAHAATRRADRRRATADCLRARHAGRRRRRSPTSFRRPWRGPPRRARG